MVAATNSGAPARVVPEFFAVEKWRDGEWGHRDARRWLDTGRTEYRLENFVPEPGAHDTDRRNRQWVRFDESDPRFRIPSPEAPQGVAADHAGDAAIGAGCPPADGPSTGRSNSEPTEGQPASGPLTTREVNGERWTAESIAEQLQVLASIAGIDEEQVVAALHSRTEPDHPDLRSLVRYRIRRLRRQRIRQQSSSRTTWMSDAGHACERYLFYRRTHGHLAEKFGPETQARFDLGRLFERWARAELEDAGIVIREAELPVVWRETDAAGRVIVDASGRIDNTIAVPAYGRAASDMVVTDIKSTHPNVLAKIRSWDDMAESSFWWVRKYPGQVIGGAIARARQLGFDPVGTRVAVVFVCKTDGEFEVFEHQITRDDVLTLGVRLTNVQLSVAAWAEATENGEDGARHIPRRIDRAAGWCGGCPFAETVCFPDPPLADPLALTRDFRVVEWVRRRAELEEQRREFDRIDKQLKALLKDEKRAPQNWSELVVDGAGIVINKSDTGRITFTKSLVAAGVAEELE